MANKTICALTYGDTHVFTLPYGSCSTAAATVEKTVAVQDGKFSLETGARVLVKFTVTNTAASPTLNVSSTGAKPIFYKNAAISAGYLAANKIYEFVFTGTNWELIGDVDTNTTYYTGHVNCVTAAATAAKVGTTSYYTLGSNRYFMCMMRYANTYAGAITLNISSTGAKPIYINGAASSETNYTLPAGMYLVYYNGTNYYFRTNGVIDGTVAYSNYVYCSTTTSNAKYYLLGSNSTDSGSKRPYIAYNASGTANTTGVYFNGATGVLYGAAWNDYAEYRAQKEMIEPGYCVASSDNGEVYKTTKKLQACDGIVSDTFGFAIGETNNCQTPLAVAGRVLAYCEGDRKNYHAGDVVCASANGKVMKMTRRQIKKYPDRIVGIVSEIPEYETWGVNNTLVNKRIWIKVK